MASCDAINNLFVAMTNYIQPMMARKGAPSARPWQTSTPRSTWENGMGLIHNSLVFERTVPDDEGDEWVNAAFSDGSSADNCLQTPETIHFGQTNRTLRVQRRNIQTEEICVEDLRDDFQVTQVLEGVAANLDFVRNYVWESRDQSEYIRLCDHKITEKASFNIDASAFDLAGDPPTSRLTLGTLEQIYQRLIMEGAQGDGAVGYAMSSGMPVFQLFTDPNTSRDLIRQDESIREDFRFAFEGQGMNSPLIQALGTMHSFDGYRHVWNPFPQRFDLAGNRVQPYDSASATTKGYKQNVRDAYTYAPYQISVVHIPTVFTQRVPTTITSPGGGLRFDPVSYMGDFKWLNITDKTCNPRGTKGFFDAIFASASDPGNTWLGFSIVHLNCPPLRNLKPSCYS